MNIYRTNNPLEYDDVDGIIIDETAPPAAVQGVAANTAIIVGQFQRGPENELTEVGSTSQLFEVFGRSSTHSGNKELANKRWGRLKVIRVCASDAAKATLSLQDDDPAVALVVTAKYKGAYGNNLKVIVAAGSVSGKKITIKDTTPNASTPIEIYDNITTAGKTNDQLKQIFGNSMLVDVTGAGDEDPVNLTETALAGGTDGTMADTQYEAAIAIAEQVGAGNVLFADKQSATVKGYLKQHILTSPDKMVIVGTDGAEDNKTTAIADVVNYRDTAGGIIYAFNGIQTRIDGVNVWTSAVSWVASLFSNVAPHVSLAYAANAQFMAGATDVRWKLTRADYIAFKEAGIAAFEFDPEIGIKLVSAITTQILNSSKVTILRRRMAYYLTDSIARFLKNYQNAPNTRANRSEVKGSIVAFDDGQINLGILPSDAEVTGGKARLIDTEILNTNNSIAQGNFFILYKRRIHSEMRYIVLKAEIGESVIVTEGE